MLKPLAYEPQAALPDVLAACGTDNPFLITTCYRGTTSSQIPADFDPKAPSVVLFSDTRDSKPVYTLATFEQVGTVWGLAYSRRLNAVFAGAYQKRQLPFGPSGSGAIYRIDLSSGMVTTFAELAAGPDLHPRTGIISNSTDELTHDLVGKSSLGDIDIDEDEHYLFVTNLFDRRIHVFRLETGAELLSFENGFAVSGQVGEFEFGGPRKDDRPFGLETHGGYLYHVVVKSVETRDSSDPPWVLVYRSKYDGRDLTSVAWMPTTWLPPSWTRIGANPEWLRNWAPWFPWRDDYDRQGHLDFPFNSHPMPMATDLVVDDAGNLTVALRDRMTDLSLQQTTYTPERPHNERLALGVGDLLNLNVARSNPGFWKDDSLFLGENSAVGGLAQYSFASPSGPHYRMVAGAIGIQPNLEPALPQEGVLFLNSDGTKAPDRYYSGWSLEEVCGVWGTPVPRHLRAPPPTPRPTPTQDFREPFLLPTAIPSPTGTLLPVRAPGSVGDIEVVCRPTPKQSTPSPLISVTPRTSTTPTGPPTSTPTYIPTLTATNTATPTPRLNSRSLFLPQLQLNYIAVRDTFELRHTLKNVSRCSSFSSWASG